ncbi:hypothetical protein GCM10014713_65040 [Streptomyces purpureus]|uniref:Uncharacterized protein n=1 Tax=Streptomyces purpureus TaxID=1951 RepID=A0A918LX59_9ACTN|nr:hypothetical protein GCM10014713_65040 [Streptomyces purpureus]
MGHSYALAVNLTAGGAPLLVPALCLAQAETDHPRAAHRCRDARADRRTGRGHDVPRRQGAPGKVRGTLTALTRPRREAADRVRRRTWSSYGYSLRHVAHIAYAAEVPAMVSPQMQQVPRFGASLVVSGSLAMSFGPISRSLMASPALAR